MCSIIWGFVLDLYNDANHRLHTLVFYKSYKYFKSDIDIHFSSRASKAAPGNTLSAY